MARPLPTQNTPFLSSMPLTSFVALATFFSVLSIVTFLCASHKKKKSPYMLKEERKESQSSEKKILSKLSSNISSKTHLMVKMISWRKLQDGEGDDDDDDDGSEDAIWRRTIILGERCRPLDFSGNIVYDSEGNLVQESPHGSSPKKMKDCSLIPQF